MLQLLADENLNGDIVRGVLLREPNLDMVRVQDVGLLGASDAVVLAWAADHNRILLTHDRRTIPAAADTRVVAGLSMPGVVIVSSRMTAREAIDQICLLNACSDAAGWFHRILFLPL